MRHVELTLTIRGTATSDKGAVIRRRSAAEGSPFKDPALELSECTQLYLFRSPQGWSEGRLETGKNRAKVLLLTSRIQERSGMIWAAIEAPQKCRWRKWARVAT